jgi:hypothetical protein
MLGGRQPPTVRCVLRASRARGCSGGNTTVGKSDGRRIVQSEPIDTGRVDVRWINNGKSFMRKLAICTAAALALSTSLALAQGSGAAGDIGGLNTRAGTSPPAAEQGTVGQGGAAQTATPGPKAAKKAARKKNVSPQ